MKKVVLSRMAFRSRQCARPIFPRIALLLGLLMPALSQAQPYGITPVLQARSLIVVHPTFNPNDDIPYSYSDSYNPGTLWQTSLDAAVDTLHGSSASVHADFVTGTLGLQANASPAQTLWGYIRDDSGDASARITLSDEIAVSGPFGADPVPVTFRAHLQGSLQAGSSDLYPSSASFYFDYFSGNTSWSLLLRPSDPPAGVDTDYSGVFYANASQRTVKLTVSLFAATYDGGIADFANGTRVWLELPPGFSFRSRLGLLGQLNHAPTAESQSLTTTPGKPLVITLAGLDVDGDIPTFILMSSPSHGSLAGTANPNVFTYSPVEGYTGQDGFTFRTFDGLEYSTLATVSITVMPPNNPPTANDQSVTAAAGTPLTVTLTGSDPDNDPLTFHVVSPPTHGTLTGNAPNLTYTPVSGYLGSDSFTFAANDGSVDSAPGTVSITILPANTVPLANAQSVTTPEETPVQILLTGSDADNNPLNFAVASNPLHGALSGTPPNLTYTPEANYSGQDSFTFTVNDGTVDSAPATVSITVTPVNHPPVANNDSYTMDEKTVLSIPSPGLLGNDTDVDEGPLPRFDFGGWIWPTDTDDPDFTKGQRFSGYYQVDPAATSYPAMDNTLQLEYVSQNAQWELRFPDTGYVFQGGSTSVAVGNNTSFGDRYIVTFYNGGNTGTPLPSARTFLYAQMDLYDWASTGQDMLTDNSIQTTTVPLALTQNKGGRFLFGDNYQPSLIFDQLVGPKAVTAVDGDANAVGNSVTLPSGAKVQINANGSFVYDPNGQFAYLASGAAAIDSFTYIMSDRAGATSTATVSININGVNDAPALTAPIAAQIANYGAAFTYTVPAQSFTDPDDGQTLSFAASGMPQGISFDPATRTFQGTCLTPGDYAVNLVATDNGSPALSASTTFTLKVNKAALSVKADDLTRPYGQANPAFTGTLSGVVNGDNITASYATTATPSSPPGSYPITVTFNDPDNRLGNYSVTTINGSLTITQASQSITFDAIPGHSYGDASFTIGASSSSGLPVSFTSQTPSVATVSGDTITIVGAGTATIRASQAGDGNYLAATDVDQSFTVAKANQVISFNPPTTSTYGADLTLNGAASSGLAVSYAVTGPATINGNLLHLSGVGTVTVTASQPGDANYNPATSVSRSITVAKAVLTVAADNKTKVYGQANPALTYTYSGFVNGDTVGVLKGSPKASTTATTSSSVGSYPITVTQGTLSAANYSFAFVNGTMTVSVASTTVSAANVSGKFGAASVKLSASVSSVSPSSATVNEGTVTFNIRDNTGTTVGQPATGTVSKGAATAAFPASTLARGTYTISVAYTDTLTTPNFNNSAGTGPGTLTIK